MGEYWKPVNLTRREEPPAPLVPILERGDRGFHGYGEPFTDSYGAEIEVYESSSAEAPHVWLNIVGPTGDGRSNASNPPGTATAHLSEDEARALIARLQTWLDEIPTRWNRG